MLGLSSALGWVDVPTKVAKDDLQLVRIAYALSGKELMDVRVGSHWTVGHLKHELQKRMHVGEVVQSLLKDDQQLPENQKLAELGDGMMLGAIVTLDAALCLFEPCRPKDLSTMVHVQDMDKPFLDMSSAPLAARDLATAMRNAAPDLGGIQIVGGSNESGDGGRIIVIANPGNVAKRACLRALAIVDKQEACGSEDECCENSDCSDDGDAGHWQAAYISQWIIDPEDFREEEFDEPNESIRDQLRAISKLMEENLEGHFRFQFRDEVVWSPVIFGGWCSDDSIVGVLSSRVHT